MAVLRAYINGSEIGRHESHTQFDGLYGLACLRGGKVVLLRGESDNTKNEWPELKVLHVPPRLLEAPPESLSGSVLTALPIPGEGLKVTLCGIQVEAEPILVSLCRETRPDCEEKLMIVLEFPDGVAINRELGGQAFRERFPIFEDAFEKEGGKSYLGKKARRDDSTGISVLMMSESTNINEIRDDHEKIKQTFVVGRSNNAYYAYLALTGV